MIVINKSVFCGNLDGARLLGHPVYDMYSIHIMTETFNSFLENFSFVGKKTKEHHCL